MGVRSEVLVAFQSENRNQRGVLDTTAPKTDGRRLVCETPGGKPLGPWLLGAGVMIMFALSACAPQKEPPKVQQSAERYCREAGIQPGTEDFQDCVKTTEQLLLERARNSFRRIQQNEGR